MEKEIERKFVINENIPEYLHPFEKKYVFQNYLSVDENEEIRIRMQDEEGMKTYDMSYKNGTGLIREELKFKIGETIYSDLSEKIVEKPIKKYRQFYHLGVNQLMIDTYLETGTPLMVAEIEFTSEEEAKKFNPPPWFGEEVTYDDQFKNRNLWKRVQ